MAAVLVGGAFLSGFINVVLDRLISVEAVNLVLGKKLSPDLVERLKSALTNAGYLVDDAELKQLDNHEVKDWLNSLRDAIYTADDLLDRVCTKAATQKGKRNFLRRIFKSDRKMVNEIEKVVTRIEDLEKRKGYLGLQKISTSSFSWKTPSTSLVRGNVHGREDDQESLVKMLNDNNEHHLSVISIVGMGGVGKTTLSRWVYNNTELMKGFDVKAWACISENFNIVETTKNIVKEICKNTKDLGSFNSIQDALKEELSKKKFFIVLDDVWSNDHHQWKDFLAPFQYGAKGSTILLTTRKENVGSFVQKNHHLHYLEPLSEDYCWSVFAANASFPESNGNPTLERIGKKIARKCDGLPLAAETLGCLCRRHDSEEWEKILRNDIWGFSINDSKIIPALLVSYYQLPSYLKRCFVYCSLFPKDYKFWRDELILLWMAEDLLRPPNKGESLEEVGCKCFEELTSKLFFKKLRDDEYFVMHDLLHDLAIFLAGDFYCRIEELYEEQEEKKVLPRHFSQFECGSLGHPISKVFNSIAKMESLRTLYLDDLLIRESILSKFTYLRVLTLHQLVVLPDSIGELIHLRYLSLSRTYINRLPESVCNLYNLQTLILYGCTKLTMLPNGMHNLVNLLYLDLRKTSLQEMPGGISKLKHLRVLNYFVVGKNEDKGIQELGGLLNLHGSLQLKKLENIVDAKEAENARMINKNLINRLYLEWSSSDDRFSDTQNERDILDSLQPHSGLKELRIKEYKGTIFPNWVGDSSYNKMTGLSLESCNYCCMLPSLGLLPSLKKLRIQGFSKLMSVGMEFYKNEGDHRSSANALFPSLEYLEFGNMPCWEEWYSPDSEAFPQLKRIIIRDCPMLKEDMLNEILARVVSSSSDAFKVSKLEIQGHDYVEEEGSSREMLLDGYTLSVKGCKSVTEYAFKAMIISNHLCCLQEIHISDCLSVISLRGNVLPKSLQKLKISYCKKVELVQQEQKYDLVKLSIKYSCDSLTWLSLDAFPNLNTLKIYDCSNLESVSMSETPHAALQSVTIDRCPKLVSFTGEGLAAPNLTYLSVNFCKKLEALPSQMNTLLPNLHTLYICSCPNICRVPESGFPPNLKHLNIKEPLWGGWLMLNLEALTHLTIYGSHTMRVELYPYFSNFSMFED